MTHTVARLGISPSAFREIREKLSNAGYCQPDAEVLDLLPIRLFADDGVIPLFNRVGCDFFTYKCGSELYVLDYPFYALILAAMRQADDDNRDRLSFVYPDIYTSLVERIKAPGGVLPDERVEELS